MKVWRYGCAIERLGGRYRLDGSLGSGGMADVYLAWDEREEREVAIKIIKTDDLDQQTLNRFLKEASRVVGWNHPHILRVYEDVKLELLDAAHGSIVPYIVMEYVRGGDLHKRLKPGQPYPLAETLRIFAQLCSAVQYAHERNVIHRDLKPLNILFRRLPDASEQVVLSDFGLAVQVDATHHTFARGGTLAYMAPEQFRGQAIPASDIFALGVILYQLCTGKLPFRRSLEDLQRVGLFEMPERPSVVNPSLPKALDDPILTAIAEDPTKRFATAKLFWKHVRVAMMPPPAQASTTLLKDSKDKEDTRLLADPLPPAATSAHNSSQVSANVAMEQVSLSEVVDNPDSRLVEFFPPRGEDTNQLPVSSIMPAPASQLSAPPSPTREPNTVSAPTMPPNIPSIPVPKPDAPVVSAMQAVVLPASVAKPMAPPLNPATKQLNNGGVAAVDAANEAPRAAVPAHQDVPPTRGSITPTFRPRGLRGKIGRRWLIAIGLVLFVLLLVFGSIALIAPNLLGSLTGTMRGGSSSNIITIIPASKDVQGTYSIDAVPGGTTGKSQVAARLLSSTKSQSGTVNATGTGQTPATQATGSLTFYNAETVSQTVASGTVLTGADGVQVVNNVPAVIPAANPPTEGFVTIAAHAVKAGAKGNIAALDINGTCCLTGLTVRNAASFTGGQDSQTFTAVSQSDLNGFANPLETSLLVAAKADVTNQKKANEQFVAPVSCSPVAVDSNPKVGQAATKVTITVTATCSGEVYDQQAAFLQAAASLMTEANQSPGAGYALVGDILTTVKQANVVDTKGTVALLIFADGRWAYQFGDQQKVNLVNLIKGKSQNDAKTLLLQQPGVSKVTVDISGGGNTLPTDPTQINIVVQKVEGFKGTATPTTGPSTPTSPGSTATSGPSETPTSTPTPVNGL